MPPMKAMIEVVESVKATANDNNASLTMSMKNDTPLLMPMVLFDLRIHAAPAPRPVAPAERQ